MSHSRAQRGPKVIFIFFFSCELLQLVILYVCSISRSIATAAAAAAADILGDDEQQPIPGADPAGGIAVDEVICDRAVRHRDESTLDLQTNANMARKTAMGKVDLSELLRRESKARSEVSAARNAASYA